MRRVAVTGIGIVCPSGNDVDTAWTNVLAGRSSIVSITKTDVSQLPVRIAGEVKDYSVPEELMSVREQSHYGTFIHFSVGAGYQAMKQAGLDQDFCGYDPTRVGVIVGVGLGGFDFIESNMRTMMEKSPRRVSPFLIPGSVPNMAAGVLSVIRGIKGTNFTINSACASASHAITNAAFEILSGRQDVMITGGTEGDISVISNCGFANMKATSRWNDRPAEASRPFDKDRNGFVMGEGAGMMVLEELSAAKARGATILAEIVGYGSTSDAHHITAPNPEGQETSRCMKIALDDAGLKPEDIDYINAHGTSTPLGDIAETVAIRKTFGAHADKLLVSSTKSIMGHLLGAAGGVESIFCIMALMTGKIPPTINLQNQDPQCDLNYVPNKSIEANIGYALNNSFGFGGTNSTLVFKRAD